MAISLVTRGARAFALAALVWSLSLSPSFAHMGGRGGAPFARSASGFGHFPHFAPRGFDRRFAFNRFGFHRFGPNRFNRFGFDRFNRFGFGAFGGNALIIGGWGWGGGFPVPAAASEPIIAGDGAPVIINIGADPPSGGAGAGYRGACVTHKLDYDSAGKYVGERQSSQC